MFQISAETLTQKPIQHTDRAPVHSLRPQVVKEDTNRAAPIHHRSAQTSTVKQSFTQPRTYYAKKDTQYYKRKWPSISLPRQTNRKSIIEDLPKQWNTTGPIPFNIWFTYKHDILEMKQPLHYYENMQKTVNKYIAAFINLDKQKSAGDVHVTCMDNSYCRNILEYAYPDLIPYFDSETEGAYKGDMCRLAALYLYGGYYFDVDIEVIEPYVHNSTILFTTVMDWDNIGIFQAFLASSPGHPVIKANLDVMLLFYKHHFSERTFIMGPMTLVEAYRALVGSSRLTARGLPSRAWETTLQGRYVDEYDTFMNAIGKFLEILPVAGASYYTTELFKFFFITHHVPFFFWFFKTERGIVDKSTALLQESRRDMGKYQNHYENLPRREIKDPYYRVLCNAFVHDPEIEVPYFYSRIVGSGHCPVEPHTEDSDHDEGNAINRYFRNLLSVILKISNKP